MNKSTITLTLGENAENHVGMQMIGDGLADRGYSLEDLQIIQQKFEAAGIYTEIVELTPSTEDVRADQAWILIARDAAPTLLGSCAAYDSLWTELAGLEWDRKAFMYGRVVNKKARWNLIFDEIAQEPNYAEKRGRVVSHAQVPRLSQLRKLLGGPIDRVEALKVEGNYYYNNPACGIGFHGDSERKKVVGIRMGESASLHYQWFLRKEPIGKRKVIELNGGDVYVMSEKATGNDWKKSSIPTLRHAVGKMFTEIKPKRKAGQIVGKNKKIKLES